jgi:hypothetical protein
MGKQKGKENEGLLVFCSSSSQGQEPHAEKD